MKSFWILVAGLLFACMGAFAKLGSASFSNVELVFFRSLVGVCLVGLYAAGKGTSIRTAHWRPQMFRSVYMMVAVLVYFYALARLPLAVAMTLTNTGPLFVIPLAAFLLNERPHRLQILGVAIGFVGVMILVRPDEHHAELVPMLIGLGAGFFNGMTLVAARQLGLLLEPEWRVVFYLSLVATVLTGGWLFATTSFHTVTAGSIPILLGLGLTGTAAQWAVLRAYKVGRTFLVASLTYSNVVFASLLGVWLWGDVLSPRSWLSFGVIALGGVLASSRKRALPARTLAAETTTS